MSRHGYETTFLSGRKVYWCPSYEGHLAFCPQPTDHDSYIWCCKSYYLGHTEKPSCCLYVLPVGTIIALILSCIVLLSMFIFFTCWCLPICPLNKKIAENSEMNEEEIFVLKNNETDKRKLKLLTQQKRIIEQQKENAKHSCESKIGFR